MASEIFFRGTTVEVDVRSFGNQAQLASVGTRLQQLGMQVVASSTPSSVIEGHLPIGQLTAAATLPGVVGIDPAYRPRFGNQGSANDQGEQVLRADVAKQQFAINGSGITVGVLSDSANKFQGGLADSIRTGDLPPAARINLLQDGPDGSTDEGRAMLEDIYDIA